MYFKFKNSCVRQAMAVRFPSARARKKWLRNCMKTHLDKMENRIPPTDVLPRPVLPYGKRVGSKCAVGSRRGFRKFKCIGNYDMDGKCMPCDGNLLPRTNIRNMAFTKPRVMFNKSDISWHYPSTAIGRTYRGLRRGFRGKLSQWNLGMGKAPFRSRGFNNSRAQYDWGYFV